MKTCNPKTSSMATYSVDAEKPCLENERKKPRNFKTFRKIIICWLCYKIKNFFHVI